MSRPIQPDCWADPPMHAFIPAAQTRVYGGLPYGRFRQRGWGAWTLLVPEDRASPEKVTRPGQPCVIESPYGSWYNLISVALRRFFAHLTYCVVSVLLVYLCTVYHYCSLFALSLLLVVSFIGSSLHIPSFAPSRRTTVSSFVPASCIADIAVAPSSHDTCSCPASMQTYAA